MNELERLLVACVEHDEDKRGLRINPDSLSVVADWVEENSPDSVADDVRLVVESYLESIVTTPPNHTACLADNDEDDPAKRRTLYLDLTRKGRGRNRTVVLSLWEMEGHTRLNLWSGVAPFFAEGDRQEEAITPHIRMARWHAVVHILGYSPLLLLACCAAEGAAV